MATWWARQIRLMPLTWLNSSVTVSPKIQPAPRGLRLKLGLWPAKANDILGNILLGIGPQEISIGTLGGDLHESIDGLDLVDVLEIGSETSVDAEDLLVDDGGDVQVIEALHGVFPGIGAAVLLDALIVEAVGSGDGSALVVSSEQHHLVWVTSLQAQQQLDGLDAEPASVDVVAHEDVLLLGHLSSELEEFQ